MDPLNTPTRFNVLKEVTDWEYPSHTYVTINRNQKCVGYYKNNVEPYIEFKKALPFNTSRRKFESDKAREQLWNVDSE